LLRQPQDMLKPCHDSVSSARPQASAKPSTMTRALIRFS
jgi:hypothetical protein